MLSKEKFIKVITDLKDLCDRIDLVDLALKQISSDFCGLYIPQVLDITVGVLEEVFEDTETQWLGYFIYEKDWLTSYHDGDIIDENGKKIIIKSWADVYDFLMESKNAK